MPVVPMHLYSLGKCISNQNLDNYAIMQAKFSNTACFKGLYVLSHATPNTKN